jgi:3-methyladenine DNA glycosylase AlkD
MDPKTFHKTLKQLFEENRDAERAEAMKAYMKGRFDFLGLSRPARDLIQKELFAEFKVTDATMLEEVVRELWSKKFREYHYVALDLLTKNKKFIKDLNVDFFEYLIETNSWWDTVDGISTNVIGTYYKHHTNKYQKELKSWAKSDDFWKRRACIIFQLKYKEKVDLEWLVSRIMENNSSKEFFLQKAIGWSLREYSKFDSRWVINFVDSTPLMPLSKREALRIVMK